MDSVVLQSVTKRFRHKPALFNWVGKERAGETRALADVSFSLAPGKVLVLLGPNGSGKTTTLKLISTVLLPDEGHVLVHGNDTRRDSGAARRNVGFALANERSFFPRLSARENLDFFATLDEVPRKLRKGRIELLLERVGLSDAADTLVMKFSSGMYQRMGIARALLKSPSIVLLDEPTRSLDPASATNFCNLVRGLAEDGAAILIASHNFQETAAVADSVIVLQQGKVAGHLRETGATAFGTPASGFSASTSTASGHADSEFTVDEIRSFYFQVTGEIDAERFQEPRHEALAVCG